MLKIDDMKMSILLFLGLCLTMGAQAQYSFVVNGEITTDDCENCKVYLQRLDLDWVKAQIENPDAQPVNVDSAVVKDGKFVLRYAGKERGELLNVAMPEKNFACQAIGEEGTIRMEVRYFDELYWAVIGGTPMNDGLMREIFRPSYEVLGLNVDGVAADAPEGEEKEDEDVMPLMRDMMRSWRTFVQAHIQYPCGQVLFLLTPQPGIKAPEEIMRLAAQRIKKRQEQAERALGNVVKEGDMMVDFEGSTLAGEPFKLSEEVGRHKLLMLDFWASWCGPCMKELPNVVAVYNDFKDKGLQIVSVSCDRDEKAWRDAVAANGMVWPQILDSTGKGFGTITKSYGVAGIPCVLLIDSSGKIVARGLRGQEIREAVEKFLKE